MTDSWYNALRMKHRRWIITVLAAASVCVMLYVVYIRTARTDTWAAVSYDATHSITLTLDTIVLVKGGGRVGAFRLIRNASHGGLFNGAKYEYWLLPKNGLNFQDPQVSHGFGYVWESDLTGDQLYIQIGDLWIEWSLSNHVYPNPGRGPIAPIAITATPWKHIENVDLDPVNEVLQWIGRVEPYESATGP